uniref:NADH-ubiquinone oxidoreductase chain 5 n=1 Tax=Spondylus violaceus TaxID=1163653 RepID=A0A515MNP4_9BIVA|nr:NADH dehydrogenase subunit 5 [Spondylus violaceus]
MRLLSVFGSVLSFLLSVWVGEGSFFLEWELFSVGNEFMSFELVVDSVGLSFMGVVFFITSCVLSFSFYYMMGEEVLDRFVYLVMLFVMSMGFLIFFPSLFGFMLGWDGLGVVSFLLVVFYPSDSSLAAGMVTGLTNRLGDAFLVAAIIFTGSFGSWHALGIWGVVGFLVLIGAMTKSAQYPFSSWLLSAMAAPTPVSALVHSSTLVTAGVYLLVRLFPGIGMLELCVLEWSSAFTAFLAGAAACYESDLKKVVALSTLSQVAVMMYCLSIGLPELSFFHLLNHAVYKALLFMSVGVVIKEHSQDMRRLGGSLGDNYSLKGYVFLCLVCLCGVPFFSGYYSKDLVLEGALMGGVNLVAGFMFFLGVVLSGCYSARLMYYGFFSESVSGYMGLKGDSKYGCNVHSFCFPLFTLCLGLGSGMSWYFSGSSVVLVSEFHKVFLILSPFIGAFFILQDYYEKEFNWGISVDGWNKVGSKVSKAEVYFSELGFLEGLTSQPFVWVGCKLSRGLYESLDQGWLEFFGPSGIKSVLVGVSRSVGGYSKHAYNWFFLCYMFLIIWMGVWWGVLY